MVITLEVTVNTGTAYVAEHRKLKCLK